MLDTEVVNTVNSKNSHHKTKAFFSIFLILCVYIYIFTKLMVDNHFIMNAKHYAVYLKLTQCGTPIISQKLKEKEKTQNTHSHTHTHTKGYQQHGRRGSPRPSFP